MLVDLGEMYLGSGPGMSLCTVFMDAERLNGVLPHPALVSLFENAAKDAGVGLQRSAQVGVLTDLSYVQHVGKGVAAIDLGFPMRYSHSSLEVCQLNDLVDLSALLGCRTCAHWPRLFTKAFGMNYTLGVDIGTFETKGVLVDAAGVVIATAHHRA